MIFTPIIFRLPLQVIKGVYPQCLRTRPACRCLPKEYRRMAESIGSSARSLTQVFWRLPTWTWEGTILAPKRGESIRPQSHAEGANYLSGPSCGVHRCGVFKAWSLWALPGDGPFGSMVRLPSVCSPRTRASNLSIDDKRQHLFVPLVAFGRARRSTRLENIQRFVQDSPMFLQLSRPRTEWSSVWILRSGLQNGG